MIRKREEKRSERESGQEKGRWRKGKEDERVWSWEGSGKGRG